MRQMTQGELMWVVGIIEGEGCILWAGARPSPRIAVVMCDRDVIERLAELTGLGAVTAPTDPNRPANWNPTWKWLVSAQREFLQLAYAIEPHLMSRRSARLAEVMEQLVTHRADVLERQAQRREICLRGHDKTLVGVTREGGCRECKSDRAKARRAGKLAL